MSLDVSPSKGFLEKMKAGEKKVKGKFGRKKMKTAKKKGLMNFGKKPMMDDEDGDE